MASWLWSSWQLCNEGVHALEGGGKMRGRAGFKRPEARCAAHASARKSGVAKR